jgi:helix-turn-helix protein
VSEEQFEPLLDSEEAAALLRIHPKTLQRLARRGEGMVILASGSNANIRA